MTTPTKLRAACLLRVSTDQQTIENQREAVRVMVEARGYEPVFYEEQGVSGSGSSDDRPVLGSIVEAARRGEVRAVAVVALDRLGRVQLDILNLVARLDAYGCKVMSVREGWVEDAGQQRGLLVGIYGWLAETEKANLVARTKAGLARARRDGKKLGRPSVLLPRDVERAKAMRAKKATWAEVGAALGVNADTVRLASKGW